MIAIKKTDDFSRYCLKRIVKLSSLRIANKFQSPHSWVFIFIKIFHLMSDKNKNKLIIAIVVIIALICTYLLQFLEGEIRSYLINNGENQYMFSWWFFALDSLLTVLIILGFLNAIWSVSISKKFKILLTVVSLISYVYLLVNRANLLQLLNEIHQSS